MVTSKNGKSKAASTTVQASRKNVKRTRKIVHEIGSDVLSQDDVARLVNSIENVEDRTLMILGFTTGMRASEIVSLEPINFEFGTGTVKIWDKRRRHYRTVFLTDTVIDEVRNLLDSMKESSGPRLFPYAAKVIEAKIQKYTLKITGKSRSWESVRRTYISTSARLDVPIKIVVDNTGELPSTIVKYYMATPVINARRKLNEAVLYPDSPRLMLKIDELKKILERPYVEIINKISSEKSRTGASPNA